MTSNFWAQRLGQQTQTTPVAPAAPVAAPSNAGAWWMPQQPAPAPQQPVQQVTQHPVADPNAQVPIEILLSQEDYTTDKAKSAKMHDKCPDCGSPNFMGIGRAAKRCAECGYNELFTHSTHGATGIGQKDLPVYAARVQQSGVPAGFPAMGSVVGHV